MDLITPLVSKIEDLFSKKKNVFIAIDGTGGAGKSTLSKHLKKAIPELKVLRMDLYYDPVLDRTDYLRVRDELLLPLKNNQKGKSKVYDWPNKQFVEGGSVEPGGIIVFEGVFAMEKNLVDLYDYRIWIDCPVEEGMERGLTRDNGAYRENWENAWVPGMKKYIEDQKPYQMADMVVSYRDIPKFEE